MYNIIIYTYQDQYLKDYLKKTIPRISPILSFVDLHVYQFHGGVQL